MVIVRALKYGIKIVHLCNRLAEAGDQNAEQKKKMPCRALHADFLLHSLKDCPTNAVSYRRSALWASESPPKPTWFNEHLEREKATIVLQALAPKISVSKTRHFGYRAGRCKGSAKLACMASADENGAA
jgi:hypothetical protein